MTMTFEKLKILYKNRENKKENWIEFSGRCGNCQKDVTVRIYSWVEGCEIIGGALYEDEGEHYFKCNTCFDLNPALTNFKPCEVYARVVGYLRPVNQFNPGKQQEFKERVNFKIPEDLDSKI